EANEGVIANPTKGSMTSNERMGATPRVGMSKRKTSIARNVARARLNPDSFSRALSRRFAYDYRSLPHGILPTCRTSPDKQPPCGHTLMKSAITLLFLVAVLTFLGEASPIQAYQPAAPTFETQVRPILKAYCFDCHGEGEKLKGGLDLRLGRLIA